MTVLLSLAMIGAALTALALVWYSTYGPGSRTRPSSQSLELLESVSRQVGDRLFLRTPEPADLDFFVEMASDPVAAEANGWDHSEAAIVRRRFASPRLFRQVQAGELVAVERSSGARVGTLRFSVAPHGPKNAVSVGIHVHTDHRNQGYGREIMAGGIELVQRTGAPVRVGTRVTNLGMQQIMRRLGYEPEPGTLPYAAPDGRTYDAYWYHCDRPDRPAAQYRDIDD